MLIDDVTITLKGGNGGTGRAAFNKVPLMQGPVGGDGGHGGNVWFEGVSDLSALLQFKHRKEVLGNDGAHGRDRYRDGERGQDITLKIPIGTEIINTLTGFSKEMLHVGERILAAGGGKGGRGNFKFRSSTNTSPQEFEEGTPGDVIPYRLVLKMIADVGLIGLPNAGKSSLINEVTAAKSKIGNYAFTTLEAHLGNYYGLILADIPGLIEGASEGKGLGHKFLRHIERTRVLFHLISCESEDVVADYKVIRSELERYNPELLKKQEYVFLTKTDVMTPEIIKEKLAELKKVKVKAIPISVLDNDSIDQVKKILSTLSEAKNAPDTHSEIR